MVETFQRIFRDVADISRIASGIAPGAVNLLGAHTCYNHGFALAIATPQKTRIDLCESRDGVNHFHNLGAAETVTCSFEDDLPEGAAGALLGSMFVLLDHDFAVSPVCALIREGFPAGAGLSWSAALQVAMMRALGGLFGFNLEGVRLAALAQRVDLEYSGINCGIIDQMTSIFADETGMLLLDSRTYERNFLPLPDAAEIVVVDSGIASIFKENAYVERRAECEEACRRLAVPALRDVTDPDFLSTLPPLLGKRARHIVTENARVLDAATGVSARRFGELMNESHASLRDEFDVSMPLLEILAGIFRENTYTYGARLTGGGFGGACVALVEKGRRLDVAGDVLARYRESGGHGRLLIP